MKKVIVILLGLSISGCTMINPTKPNPVTIIPSIPTDLRVCNKKPVVKPKKELTVDDVEKYWKEDRYRLVIVNKCYVRLKDLIEQARNGVVQE